MYDQGNRVVAVDSLVWVTGSDIEDRFPAGPRCMSALSWAAQGVSQSLSGPLMLPGGEGPLAVVEAFSAAVSRQ